MSSLPWSSSQARTLQAAGLCSGISEGSLALLLMWLCRNPGSPISCILRIPAAPLYQRGHHCWSPGEWQKALPSGGVGKGAGWTGPGLRIPPHSWHHGLPEGPGKGVQGLQTLLAPE